MLPCDFHVFGPLKKHLKGKRFNSDDVLKDTVKDWVSSQPQEFWEQGILGLVQQWDRCAQAYVQEESDPVDDETDEDEDTTSTKVRAYVKITVLRERNAIECHSELVEALENNALPYRTVERCKGKLQQERESNSDEQRSGRSVSVRTDLARAVLERLIDYIKDVIELFEFSENLCFEITFDEIKIIRTVLLLRLSPERDGRDSRVVKVSNHGWPCHEFELSTTKDPPCRGVMHVKCAEFKRHPVGVVW
ncbi:HTH_48 domain-containing protein [Trichonephila clavipes]|nr:HTH_48 domain-containing protein [Trichonephila clavipes]